MALSRRRRWRRRNTGLSSSVHRPSLACTSCVLFVVLMISNAAGFVSKSLQIDPIILSGSTTLPPKPSIRLTSSSIQLSAAEKVDAEGRSGGGGIDDDDDSARRRSDRIASALIFAAVPAASLTLPALLSVGLYAPLVVAKRAVVYGMAGTIVGVAAARGAEDDASLGRRLEKLTAEILPVAAGDTSPEKEKDEEEEDARFRELRALDGIDSSAQSAALPAIVAGSLALSILILRLQDGGTGDVPESGAMAALGDLARDAVPSLVGMSNAAVLGLFTRAELDRAVRAWGLSDPAPSKNDTEEEEESSEGASAASIATPLALALVSAAYLLPPSLAWPARNVASMSLGIAVSRAVQLPRLGPIAAALTALVLYDVFSVFVSLVELGGATLAASGAAGGESTTAAATTVASTSASSSAMGAVALSKVGGASALTGDGGALSLWQPGLLEVRLRGRATDLLGLGDAVFPSLLATFAFRFDRKEDAGEGESDRPLLYFSAAMFGFTTGCLACEFVPGIDSTGLPALLFIVPAMFTSVLGLAAVRGDNVWSFDPIAPDASEES
mmetsp:Transcript_34919/g.104156  ORF Transcript_34919/g.104156 Transcript_34919/m.104156 type:complete len:558 (-) Transcript_34919:178-1851(-)